MDEPARETAGEPAVPGRGRAHWLLVGASALAPLGLVAARFLLTPSPSGVGTHEQLGLPPCRAVQWSGLPCPGCGVTTAVTWFAHGEPWMSLVTQPFGFALGLGALLALPLALAATWLGRDLGYELRLLRLRRVWIPIAVLALCAWAYKAFVMVRA